LRLLDRLSVAGMALGGIACLAMAGLVTLEVLLRWALNVSTQIADEWAGYLLLGASFLGLGYTARHDAFIRVELLMVRLDGRARRAARLVHLLAAALVGAVLLVWLWAQAEQSYRMGSRSIFVSRTSLWIPQGLMVLGVAIFMVQLVAEAVRLVRGESADG
jgi:TRAP-type C4-dicarboxylate transport system permease small subunit